MDRDHVMLHASGMGSSAVALALGRQDHQRANHILSRDGLMISYYIYTICIG